MRTRSKLTLGTAAALVALAGIGATQPSLTHRLGLLTEEAGAAPQPAAPQAMPVPVARVLKETLPVTLDYPARTEAIRNVTLQAKVPGYVKEQVAADGSDVNEGDLLYRIDPRDFQASLDQ